MTRPYTMKQRTGETKPKRPRSYGNGGSHSGIAKPCPTCYAPMHRYRETWRCTKHGTPSKP